MAPLNTFGKRFRFLRGDVTQKEFAALLKTSEGNISKYENDYTYPDAELLRELVEQRKVSLNWLMFGIGPKYLHEIPKDKVVEQLLEENLELKVMTNNLLKNIDSVIAETRSKYTMKKK